MNHDFKNRVVITGIGIIASNGKGKTEFFNNCYNGRSGLKKCTLFETSNFNTQIAGEINEIKYPYESENPYEKSRIEYLIEDCIEELLADSRLNATKISALKERACLSFATSLGTNCNLLQYEKEINQGKDAKREWMISIAKLVPGIKEILGIEGGCFTTTTACAASTTGIGIGYDLIKFGKADLVIVGGADPLNEFSYYGFNALHALTKSICKPFDRERDGINIGEGCGFITLESIESAKRRNAKIYGEIFGYGINNDAYHITSPDPEGRGAYLSMKMACEQGENNLESINYINAHGTGTKLNDSMELKAIQKLFGNCKEEVLVSSIKPLVGHCLAAAGIIEFILTILSIENVLCVGNVNLQNVINENGCKNVVLLKSNKKKKITKALTNNFAFAGNTASILLGKFKE